MALNPGEQITLTKRIGEALQSDSMPDINLTLNTFRAPDSPEPEYANEWENYEYILRRLSGVSDEILIGLHAHLYPDVSTETATAGHIGPWKDGLFRLFISHTNANKQLAGEVSDRLLDYGIDAFVAHDVIEPTKEWMDEIEAALATCDSLAAVLTEDFVASKWCDQEIGYVAARGVLIVAVRQGADPHGFISKYQAVPGDTTPQAAGSIARGIFETLMANSQTKNRMAPALAHAYANGKGHDAAVVNLARLKMIPKEGWTQDMVELVEGVSQGEISTSLSEHLDVLLSRESSNADVPDFESALASDFQSASGGDDDIPF
jgi:hypothetical protein